MVEPSHRMRWRCEGERGVRILCLLAVRILNVSPILISSRIPPYRMRLEHYKPAIYIPRENTHARKSSPLFFFFF